MALGSRGAASTSPTVMRREPSRYCSARPSSLVQYGEADAVPDRGRTLLVAGAEGHGVGSVGRVSAGAGAAGFEEAQPAVPVEIPPPTRTTLALRHLRILLPNL